MNVKNFRILWQVPPPTDPVRGKILAVMAEDITNSEACITLADVHRLMWL